MDLITGYKRSFMEAVQDRFTLTCYLQKFLKKNCCHAYSQKNIDNKRLEVNIALEKVDEKQLMGRLVIDVTLGVLSLTVSTIDQQSYDSLYLTTLMRLCQQKNSDSPPYLMKVNPYHGQISLVCDLVVGSLASHPEELFQLAEDELKQMRKQMGKQLQHIKSICQSLDSSICEMLQQREFKDQKDVKDSLSELKKYIISSSGYAWSMLKNQKMCQKHNEIRMQMRTSFNERVRGGNFKSNIFISSISNGPIQAIDKFYILSHGDDNYLERVSLKKEVPNSQEYQIEEIDIAPEDMAELREHRQYKVGRRHLTIRQMPWQDALRELSVVEMLPENRYHGIPQYMRLKDVPPEDQDFLLTTKIQGCSYGSYLEKNKKVLSIPTLIHILTQISRSMMYLRDNSVVSNHLTPGSILVGPNLSVTLNNLSNSYHPKLEKRLQQKGVTDYFSQTKLYKNIIPYVSHSNMGIDNSYCSQLSDVYSFGFLLFRSLFRKNLYDVKTSTIYGKKELEVVVHMCHKAVFSHEKIKFLVFDHLKLLTQFSLMAAAHNIRGMEIPADLETEMCRYMKLCRSEDSINNRLVEKRPYLDWLVIIMSEANRFFQTKFSV